MRTLAVKEPSNTQRRQADVNRAVVQPSHRSLSSGVLQRKSSCACGGGCPRCQEQALLQTKLKIGEPGDEYEQEADLVADEVMQMPEPSVQRQMEPEEEDEEGMVQRKAIAANPVYLPVGLLAGEQVQRECTECEDEVHRQPMEDEEEEEPIQTKEVLGSTPAVTSEVASRIQSLKGSGQPFSTSLSSFFEPRFGYDFSQVRVQVDPESAHQVQARAYTIGNTIVFGQGQYQPDTDVGRRLLAHELTHVVQQGDTTSREKKIVNRSPAVPLLQLKTQGQPCTQQATIDDAVEKAHLLIRFALIRLELIRAAARTEGTDENEDIAGYRDTVKNTFGNDATVVIIERINTELEMIDTKLQASPQQLCALQAERGCQEGYKAFFDPDVANTIFYCPVFFEPANSPNERGLTIIHEVAHVIGKVHGGFDKEDESMVFKCGIGLGITYNQALDNAYAYDTLVGCLTKTRERLSGKEELTKKEMREQKKLLKQEEQK